MADNNTFDAIVVGSGISGGWAAKELTERGLSVVMLERGFNIEHGKDYEKVINRYGNILIAEEELSKWSGIILF